MRRHDCVHRTWHVLKVFIEFQRNWLFVEHSRMKFMQQNCSVVIGFVGFISWIMPRHRFIMGPGSSVGIATELRAGRSGIAYRWGRDFPSVQTGPGTHPASCKMGIGSFPGVKCGQEVLLTTHHFLMPWPWKSIAIPLPTLWATPGL